MHSSEQASDDFMEYALRHGFGDVHVTVDPASGMRAIVAIHNTNRGPALGGCRFVAYQNNHQAILDAMRLARGMSYKSALANLPLGGGKSVILKPSTPYDRAAYFHHFGEFVQSLNGRYITAMDSGTDIDDMDIIAQHTQYVASTSAQGDPSPFTVQGLLRGIQAAVLFKFDKDRLEGLHMTIQGLGHVGYALAGLLHQHGVRLTVADTNAALAAGAVAAFGATVVSTDVIHSVPCDVYIPCALGAIINDTSINEFNTTVIAGAANNQLEHLRHADLLHKKGILYAPDYVINAGGVIYAASQYLSTSEQAMHEKINDIHHTLLDIFQRSVAEKQTTCAIADKIAEERIFMLNAG